MDHSRDALPIGWYGSWDGRVQRQYVVLREVILPRHVGVDSVQGFDCWTRNCGRVLGYTVGKDRRGREISMEFLQSKSK